MDYTEKIEIILAKYSVIKELYIECEETDPELKTNLQPLNEFRAALDHIMKIWLSMLDGNEDDILEQFRKLNSHLDRAFYDVCDMLSINYRNKIADTLESYEVDTIRTALPTYYSDIKPFIVEVGCRIAKYRYKKGTVNSTSEQTLEGFEEYKQDVFILREYYQQVITAQTQLEEIAKKERKRISKENRKNLIIGGLIGFICSAIVSLFFFLIAS